MTVPAAERTRADTAYARFHFIGRALARPQARIVRLLHRHFARAPQFVLLTTRGRRTGLPREVLLPCVRTEETIVVYSTHSVNMTFGDYPLRHSVAGADTQ